MKFILFVEGETERKALPEFLSRCITLRFSEGKHVRFEAIDLKGWANLHKEVAQRSRDYIEGPEKDKIIAIISLLDLYGPDFCPEGESIATRYELGVEHMKRSMDDKKYRHFFAVHETEAWLLSDPRIFPQKVQEALKPLSKNPEKINSGHPPAKQLNTIYRSKLNRSYNKVTDGANLFPQLDAKIALDACPYLNQMIEGLVNLVKAHKGK
ncbi:MAG: DUF4276 family protein [Capsulimonas sp.]|uniref:DUF4276 family protein n=1 Tax=Capsulimonas sp. TaxID=2494211 RepID=UPI003265AB1B